MASWVFEQGSLTRRLKAACGARFNVRVVRQGFAHPYPDEALLLKLRSGRRALVREVELRSGERPLILARSVLPVRTLKGAGRRLARLENRPLGEILFASRRVRRHGLEAARAEIHRWRPEVRAGLEPAATVWGRRSLYSIAGRPLLVAEFFLPAVLSAAESA
jgi:chorismate--pyruvate lyase